MNYYIITGASRGLGEAVGSKLLIKDNTIFYLARTRNYFLEEAALENQATLHFIECDLTNVAQISNVMEDVFERIDDLRAAKITLINNAGMVEPIKYVGDAEENEMIANVQLNLLAPMLLCEFFIKKTKELPCEAIIVNITSGAANRPTSGWSAYCSTKAGLNMFTKTIGVEQGERGNKVIAIAFSPGIMDTQMQGTIRSAGKENFSSIEQFKDYHEKGMLRSPGFVAKVLIQLLSGSIENGRIYDIKEYV
ncbi:short-chain dehydrogenase [Bacillus sp. SA1-12]|uniref:(S)-benzoin forming benzil reductase n=1 Tax=Bacillus sp. SA1-12 TaxID=1455638 RepID=UPI00062739DA|nr:(S)-benzoin forming benzil reductase [Bacillus sp. SA1-12]KKI90165.1 short-chain dehydrogenase [Bacillus sp. SA1-12]